MVCSLPELGIFWGDLNDTVWLSMTGLKWWWHEKLQEGRLMEPMYCLHTSQLNPFLGGAPSMGLPSSPHPN